MGALSGDQPAVAQDTTDKYLIVEQIADTVLGDPSAFDLNEQVGSAVRSYDKAAAAPLVHTLIGHLTEHPDDARPLEALVVMGLAHPAVLKEAKVPLAHEGRRLAGLLERRGEADHAQEVLEFLARSDPADRGIDKDLASIMRRTGNVDRLVDRYLQRAEEAVADGRRRDAITWLREVLMLDRTRRDVARMIRDLQYADREVKEGWSRRFRVAALTLLACGLVVGAFFRELHLQRMYANLPEARVRDVESYQARLTGIDALIASNPLWLGMFEAGRERASLRGEIDKMGARMAEQARTEANQRAELEALLDWYRARGLMFVQQDNFRDALEQYQLALSEAPEGWEHRERVESDVEAIADRLAAEAVAPEAAVPEAAVPEAEASPAAPAEEPDGGDPR